MQDVVWAQDKLERAAGLSTNCITKTISLASAGPSGVAIKSKVTRRSKNKKRNATKEKAKETVRDVNMKELPFAQQ